MGRSLSNGTKLGPKFLMINFNDFGLKNFVFEPTSWSRWAILKF